MPSALLPFADRQPPAVSHRARPSRNSRALAPSTASLHAAPYRPGSAARRPPTRNEAKIRRTPGLTATHATPPGPLVYVG